MNFLSGFSNMPGPAKVVVLIASGAGMSSIVAALIPGSNPMFTYIAIGVVAVAAALVLWKLALHLRGKMKSGSFALGLSKSAGRSVADPALKARMDDLRKKFDEGVETFKKNGKDIYSLPWYMIVGPSASGKTEAIRHSNIGFPPGLQDFLQGTGGTLSMNWWFTNHAVIIDTAGRMFMEEGEGTEWKEFLKLLRKDRPDCPVNGLLLVISVENLLKDSAEKIEQVAGVIARQLDVIQRTLDVRFPVTVLVTKCDKIIGFRDFFETLNDPALQHQMLGWSNPASLDEPFKAEAVSTHLETVRQKLLKRRMGLLQNPVHTEDPTARRTDQVDELFELPNNLVRIAPRLKSYLEKIFVAGEWSPKPLFLRGIYFTSSMREGQALDMALAQSLGVDVDSIPGGKEYSKEKAYFLRDTFMSKIFREKGLVTRATNVNKQIAKQRALLAFGSIAAVVLVGAIVAFQVWQFRTTIGAPAQFWKSVNTWDAWTRERADRAPGEDRWPVVRPEGDKWVYNARFGDASGFANPGNPAGAIVSSNGGLPELLTETATWAGKGIDPPLIAVLAVPENSIERDMIGAHRSLTERHVLMPLLSAVRNKLANEPETTWNDDAITSLAQLVRVQTFAHGLTPATDSGGGLLDAAKSLAAGKAPTPGARSGTLALAPMLTTLLGPDEARAVPASEVASLQAAADAAYGGAFKSDSPLERLEATLPDNTAKVEKAVEAMVTSLKNMGAGGEALGRIRAVADALDEFRKAELDLLAIPFVQATDPAERPSATGGTIKDPQTVAEYRDRFQAEFDKAFTRLTAANDAVGAAVQQMGPDIASNPIEAFERSDKELRALVATAFSRLSEQLPAKAGSLASQIPGQAAAAVGAAGSQALAAIDSQVSQEPAPIASLRKRLDDERAVTEQQLGEQLVALRARLGTTLPMLAMGTLGREQVRAYQLRYSMYAAAKNAVEEAAKPVEADEGEGFASPAIAIGRVNERAAKAAAEIESSATWAALPSEKWLQAGNTLEADRAAGAGRAKRIVDLASMRAMNAVVLAELGRDWLKTSDSVRRAVGQLAESPEAKERVADMEEKARQLWDSRRWIHPELPFAGFEPDESFDAGYHPGAAAELLGALGEIRQKTRSTSESGGGAILGSVEIRSSETYRRAMDSADKYVGDFISRWRRWAVESDPTVETWDSLAKALDDTDAASINEALLGLRDQARLAIDAVNIPALEGSADRRAAAIKEIDAEYKEIEEATAKNLFVRWRSLSKMSPEKAADALRAEIRRGKGGDVLQEIGSRESYWNKLQFAMLNALAGGAGGEITRAQQLLMKDAKAVPLFRGTTSNPDLSADQLQAISVAMEKVGGSTTAQPGAADIEEALGEVPALFRDDARSLFGGTWMTESRRRWLDKLGRAVAAMKAEKSFEVVVEHPGNDSADPPAGKQFAAFRSDGQFLRFEGKVVVFNLNQSPPADGRRATVVLPASGSVEVLFYSTDPLGDAALANPSATATLTGGWPFLGSVLSNPASKSGGAKGRWLTQIDGVWLAVRVPERLDLALWPEAADWPAN
jgi:GTP-binding protein EngB required for normal cell division